MAKDLAPIPRFPLPDDWEPEGTRCVIVRIPDDAQYLATLTGLLDLLKWSENFARDDTKSGAATVCRTWQHALELQPITWGDCEQMILRQNPDNPCQLQQSQDGGDSWTLAFDYSLCSQVITVPAPYPDSDTGASDASAQAIRTIFEGLLNLVDCGASRDAYILAATTYMRTFDPSFANPAALGAIYDEFCPMTDEQKSYYQSDCPYTEHKSELEDCTNPDGLFQWLDCAALAIDNWLNDTSDNLMNALNSAAAALTGNGWQNASYGGGGGGAGFGIDCPTCYNMLNGTDWAGVYGYPDPPPYIAGEGVRSATYGGQTAIHISNGGYAGATVTEIQVTIDLIDVGDVTDWELKIDDVTVQTFAWVAGLHTYIFSTPTAASDIRLFMPIDSGTLGTPTAPAALLKLVCVAF